MRFVIEKHPGGGSYGDPVIGEGTGEEPIGHAFEDAGITEAGEYRVHPEFDDTSPSAFYRLAIDGTLVKIDWPSTANRRLSEAPVSF